MNIIRLLLIGGLIYFAMKQKKESTRNIILIVTGLLAVCMLSKEGFIIGINPRDGMTVTCTSTPDTIGTCTAGDGGTRQITEDACSAISGASWENPCTPLTAQGECVAARGGDTHCQTGNTITDNTMRTLTQLFSAGSPAPNIDEAAGTITIGSNTYTWNKVETPITSYDDLASRFTCSNGNPVRNVWDETSADRTRVRVDFFGPAGWAPDGPAVPLENYISCDPAPSPTPTPTPTPTTTNTPTPTPTTTNTPTPTPVPDSWYDLSDWPLIGNWWWLLIVLGVVIVGGAVVSAAAAAGGGGGGGGSGGAQA